MKKRISTTLLILGFLAVFSLLATIVWADSDDPIGVETITRGDSSRINVSSYPPANTTAEAGNVTELNMTSISVTKAWQGYYGEITGTITLDTIDGYVFYNWSANEPKGEIYTTTTNSVTWSNIKCFNFTDSGPVNLSSQEAAYGIDDKDVDGINETFNITSHVGFFVGTHNISVNSCPSTFVFGPNGYQTTYWSNVLLTDNAELIFTTIIENDDTNNDTDPTGFDGSTHDFQLLVAEDGHDGQEDTTTTYYFWAEIE